MSTIKEQFDNIAKDYDQQRRFLIPCFADFYTACYPLVAAMKNNGQVLDLGAGTGLFSSFILQIKPEMKLTLADLSMEMLGMARQRFQERKEVRYLELNFATDAIPGKYDLIISSLAIHHLHDTDKEQLYQKIYNALPEGGLFINADQVEGRTPAFDDFYKSQWRQSVLDSGLNEQAIAQSFERIKLDRFAPLELQLQMLDRAGFSEADCIYKNMNFVVFSAIKGHSSKNPGVPGL